VQIISVVEFEYKNFESIIGPIITAKQIVCCDNDITHESSNLRVSSDRERSLLLLVIFIYFTFVIYYGFKIKHIQQTV